MPGAAAARAAAPLNPKLRIQGRMQIVRLLQSIIFLKKKLMVSEAGSVGTDTRWTCSTFCICMVYSKKAEQFSAGNLRKRLTCESKVAYNFSKKYVRKHSRATPGAPPEPVNFRGFPRTPGHRPTKFNFFVGVYWAFQYTYRDTIQKKLSRRVFLVSVIVYGF